MVDGVQPRETSRLESVSYTHLDVYKRQVSFVFQDIFLFKQSILDNIRMGNPTASEEQVIAAAKAAQCHDFISKLPDGYHTVSYTHLGAAARYP